MGENDAQRFSLINTRNQPVELLLSTGTVTLPPNERIELAAEVAATPQIKELCRRRLLILRPLASEGSARSAQGEETPTAEDEEARDEQTQGKTEPTPEDTKTRGTTQRTRRREH